MILFFYIVKDIKANFLNIYFLFEFICSEYNHLIFFHVKALKDLVLLPNKETRVICLLVLISLSS